VWGKISKEKYDIQKKNPSWLNLTTKVCDECYLKFTPNFMEEKKL